MTATVIGQASWMMSRDADGHREYRIKHKIRCHPNDGPSVVLSAPGLPVPGQSWAFGNDLDPWAFCRFDATVRPIIEGEPNTYWEVEQVFATPRGGASARCSDFAVEDPLLEPVKVSGSFVKYTEQATTNRYGLALLNSAHEQIRGAPVEFDANRPTVRIEQNFPFLDLGLIASMVDTVNNFPLWGLPPRCVKLSDATWERRYYGACNTYYSLTLDFDINFRTFDRDILDEGSKVLWGKWTDNLTWEVMPLPNGDIPDPWNPSHFIGFTDYPGNPKRCLLNGAGLPVYDQVQGQIVTMTQETGQLIVVVSVGHGLITGDIVSIYGVVRETGENATVFGEVNQTWPITVVDDDSFTLDGSDSYGLGVYLGGGIWMNAGTTVGKIHVEKYNGANFLLLGIPTVL